MLIYRHAHCIAHSYINMANSQYAKKSTSMILLSYTLLNFKYIATAVFSTVLSPDH